VPGVLLLEPRVFQDDRGFFLESYNQRTMADAGIKDDFVQDNHSYSVFNVVRGLHYQLRNIQAKLVRVVTGEILDVAVDLRRSSSTFGQHCKAVLSGENRHIFYVPPGFGHGFRVLSQSAHVLYKSSNFHDPESERVIIWNDPELGIDWQLQDQPTLSTKDAAGSLFRKAEVFE